MDMMWYGLRHSFSPVLRRLYNLFLSLIAATVLCNGIQLKVDSMARLACQTACHQVMMMVS